MIDAHVHAFPDAEAGRSWQALAGFEPVRDGTLADLVPRMAAAGIERAIVLCFPRSAHREATLRAAAGPLADAAPIRRQVADELRALNRWACDLARRDPRFVAFVGLDPGVLDAGEIAEELAACVAAGAAGAKIIPPAMRRYPDDPGLRPVYEACVELGVPLLSQSGAGGVQPEGGRGHYGRPAGFAPVLRAHPGLRLVLAHLGRGYEDELSDLLQAHRDVVTDTSLRLGDPRDDGAWDPAPVRALIRRLGADRVLFGTNYPATDPVAYRERLDGLGLTAAEFAAVGRDNAARLLGG